MNEPEHIQPDTTIPQPRTKSAALRELLDELAGYLRMTAVINVETRPAPKQARTRSRDRAHPTLEARAIPVAWHVSIFPGGRIRVSEGLQQRRICDTLTGALRRVVQPYVEGLTRDIQMIAGADMTLDHLKKLERLLDDREQFRKLAEFSVAGQYVYPNAHSPSVTQHSEATAGILVDALNAVLRQYTSNAIADVRRRIFEHVKDDLASG